MDAPGPSPTSLRPARRSPSRRSSRSCPSWCPRRWTSRCSTATTTCWWSTSRPGCSCTRCRAIALRRWCTACCTRSAARACGRGSCTGSIATRPGCWWSPATTARWRGCSRCCAGGASTAATRRWCAAARRRAAAPSRRRSAATGATRPASRSTRTWPSRPSRTSRSPSCARAARCWTWSSRPAAPTRSACIWRRSAARWWATASTGTGPSSVSSASSCTPHGCGSRIPGAATRSMSPRRCRPTWRPRWSWRGAARSGRNRVSARIVPRFRSSTLSPAGISRPVVPLRSCEAPVVSAGYIPNNHVQGGDCVPTTAVTMRELLEAGVHFGHQTRRWNPKMRRFIFGERGGIYIIDLQQSIVMLQDAYDYVRNIAERNGTVLFVGTKKQAQDAVEEQARRVGQPYVNHRWLGGLLTNYRTIQDRIAALHELRRQKAEGQLELLPSKERQSTIAELEKLETNLGGLADTRKLPDAVVVIDMKKEALAVREARRLNIPVVGLVDTNCDPDDADFVIPGNDDAIRSATLIVRVLADAIAEGRNLGARPSDFAAEDGNEGDGAAAEAAEGEPSGEPPSEPAAEPAPAAAAAAAPAEAPAEPAPAEAQPTGEDAQ